MQYTKEWFATIDILISTIIWGVLLFTFFSSNFEMWQIDRIREENVANDIYRDIDIQYNSAKLWVSLHKTLDYNLNDPLALPEDYMIFFEKWDFETQEGRTYYMIETQTKDRVYNGEQYTRIIRKEERNHSEKSIYLWKIVARADKFDPWVQIDSIWVNFKNPVTGIEFYVNGNYIIEWNSKVVPHDQNRTINEYKKIKDNTNYTIIELTFFWSERTPLFTIPIHRDIQYYITPH
jgi:hypothetical protein